MCLRLHVFNLHLKQAKTRVEQLIEAAVQSWK